MQYDLKPEDLRLLMGKFGAVLICQFQERGENLEDVMWSIVQRFYSEQKLIVINVGRKKIA